MPPRKPEYDDASEYANRRRGSGRENVSPSASGARA